MIFSEIPQSPALNDPFEVNLTERREFLKTKLFMNQKG